MEKIKGFFRSGFFDARYKTKIHVFQISLVIIMFILSGARIATKPNDRPVTRADTLGIVMVRKIKPQRFICATTNAQVAI